MEEWKKQNQHYHPRLLLKWFKGEKLLYYDGEKVEHRRPETIFSEQNYFGDKDSFIEKYFANTENEAGNIVHEILSSNEKEIYIDRKSKNALTLLLAQLPIRSKSFRKKFNDEVSYLNALENKLKNYNTDWRNVNIFNPENDFHKLLKFQTTFWSSEIELPLFSGNVGMYEANFNSLRCANGENCLDCVFSPEPDTIYFPLSRNRLIIYINPKYSFANLLFRTKNEEKFLENKNDIFKNGNFLNDAINFINKNYCERSLMLRFNFIDFWEATAVPDFKNKESIDRKMNVDYSKASEDDTYKFKIKKMSTDMYKFILIENLINYWNNGMEDEIILPKNPKFLTILKEILQDLKNNLDPVTFSEYSKNGKIHDSKDWYKYSVYKVSTNETIKALSTIVFNLTKSIEDYNQKTNS